MKIVVTSASGANGNGFGKVLAFELNGAPLGNFSDDARIQDPRGLRVSHNGKWLYLNSGTDSILVLDETGKVQLDSGVIAGLNAGGGNLGPDNRYYVGLRSHNTVTAFSTDLAAGHTPILPHNVVPFPRGFAFSDDGRLFLASGIGPLGQGQNTLLVFDAKGHLLNPRLIDDNQVSPLDLAIAPNGNILVSSEFPFGHAEAVTSVREYHHQTGALVRVFSAPTAVSFQRPRGLRFGPDGHLYCVSQNSVVAFDFNNGQFLGVVIHCPRLNGQAIEFFGPRL